MKILQILLLSCFTVSWAQAQFDLDSNYYSASYLSFGYGNFSAAELQSFAPNLSAPGPDKFIFGLQSLVMKRNLCIGFGMNGMLGNTLENEQMEFNHSAFLFGLDVGYPLLSTAKHKLYPKLGVVWVIEYLQINQKQNLNLQQVQQNFEREINIDKGSLGFDFSLNWDFVPRWKEIKGRQGYGGFLIGLSAGYLCTLANDNWKYSGGEINGAPTFGTQGFYVKLTLGAATTAKDD